jgi:hypothetical protein
MSGTIEAMTHETLPDLLSEPDAARRLGLSVEQMRRLRYRGAITLTTGASDDVGKCVRLVRQRALHRPVQP